MTLLEIYKSSTQILKNAGIESAELDAEILLQKALKKDRLFLIKNPDYKLSFWQKICFDLYLKRRLRGMPIAYITGQKEFFGLDFMVNENVLIPRPESEELVSIAFEYLRQSKNKSLRVIDIGTGSGCLIISLLNELKKKKKNLNIKFLASDISKDALKVAKRNAKRFNSQKDIFFVHSDLFESGGVNNSKFDLIIANLPYVPNTDKKLPYEPKLAIYADSNGESLIRRFLSESKNHLAKSALIILELDPRNADNLKKTAIKIYSKSTVELKRDLAGFNRYLTISV